MRVYEGNSAGVEMLTDGYIEYAEEVISNRAVPDFRDGCKPVQRRILYAMHRGKVNNFTKSNSVVGKVMDELHPHGDSSIYQTMASMVDSNGTYNVPLLEGRGSFSKVYLDDKPSAPRYTEVKSGKMLEEFFLDMEGCEWKADEIGKGGEEPASLPVTYPNYFVSGTSGMAVSISMVTPSYNFWDVIGLMEKCLNNQDLTEDDMIIPDLPTGGHIVNNRRELASIMFSGKGKLKVRADVEIKGRQIIVKEVPYGMTIKSIVDRVNKSELQGISSCADLADKSGCTVEITCKSKSAVEPVLMELYRRNILQSNINVAMKAVVGEKKQLIVEGVFPMMYRWIKWRKGIIKSKYTKLLDACQEELQILSDFISFIDNESVRKEFARIAVDMGIAEAREYLVEQFPDFESHSVNFVCNRRLSQLKDGGNYRTRYDNLLSLVETYENYINFPETRIKEDIERFRSELSGSFERKTKISNMDYRFTKIEDAGIEDDSECVYEITGTKIRKMHSERVTSARVVHGKANDVLVGFDSIGRGVRVYGSELPFDRDISFADYTSSELISGYFIPYIDIYQPVKKVLFYSDGSISFLDMSDFEPASRKGRVLKSGVPEEVGSLLLGIANFVEGMFVCFRNDKELVIADLATVREKGRGYRTQIVEDKGYTSVEYLTRDTLMEKYPDAISYFYGNIDNSEE